MITVATFIMLAGFYLLYLTSERIIISDSALRSLASTNKKRTKTLGLFGLALGISICCFYFGLGAGILAGLIILMTISSLVIILAPIRLISFKGLILIFALGMLFEQINRLI